MHAKHVDTCYFEFRDFDLQSVHGNDLVCWPRVEILISAIMNDHCASFKPFSTHTLYILTNIKKFNEQKSLHIKKITWKKRLEPTAAK